MAIFALSLIPSCALFQGKDLPSTWINKQESWVETDKERILFFEEVAKHATFLGEGHAHYASDMELVIMSWKNETLVREQQIKEYRKE